MVTGHAANATLRKQCQSNGGIGRTGIGLEIQRRDEPHAVTQFFQVAGRLTERPYAAVNLGIPRVRGNRNPHLYYFGRPLHRGQQPDQFVIEP